MTDQAWPLRWDLLARYRMIEIIAVWEGRLTTNHLCKAYGIGRQQASKDINTYLREVAPDNLVYDRHLKGYVPAPDFTPHVTMGVIDEYAEMLRHNASLLENFESVDAGLPANFVMQPPSVVIASDIMQACVSAVRNNRELNFQYAVPGHPDGIADQVFPHTLICTTVGWYVRGWSRKHKGFCNLRLSRMRHPVFTSNRRRSSLITQDTDWNLITVIELQPDTSLPREHQELIAQDFAMVDDRLKVATRKALTEETLAMMGLRSDTPEHANTAGLQFCLIREAAGQAMPKESTTSS